MLCKYSSGLINQTQFFFFIPMCIRKEDLSNYKYEPKMKMKNEIRKNLWNNADRK